MSTPRIAITPGDPRGVGPEVVRDGLDALGEVVRGRVLVVGPHGVLDVDGLLEYGPSVDRPVPSDEEAGAASTQSLERAVEMALRGEVQGIVTGPVHKPSLHAAGWAVPGQTEMLASLAGARPVGMLMAAERTRLGGPLRVLLATTHLPLRDVPASVDEALLIEQARLLDAALRRDWGLERPRIALCALNPHASDGGLFGEEEQVIYAPAVQRLRESGLCVEGPVPADTVFSRALAGAFDAVVAPYHDVGMAAFKTASFGTGVNVTLGLPFVRTSPDHGTAFDLAGTGRASSSSTVEAIELALRLANARFDIGSAHV